MPEPVLEKISSEKRNPMSDRMVTAAGLLLILASIAIALLFPTFFMFAVAIIAFGIGCATLWFSFINPAVRSGEERMGKIGKNVERLRQRIGDQKK